MLTREQVQNLKVGSLVAQHLGQGRFSPARKVVSIFASGDDIHGYAYVCCYTEFGEHSRISASLKEGQSHYAIVSA